LRRTIIALLVISAAIVICVVGTFTVIDSRCSADIARWLPLYPNARIVEEDYNFRRRATGITTMVLESPDEPNVVMHWYYEQRFAEADKDPNRGLATTSFTVESGAGDTGSTIYLYSRCGQ
jgi:hypothetical protein